MFLKNHAKSKVFQNNWRPQAFFVKILCQVGILFLLQQKFRLSRYTLPPASSAIYGRGAERRVWWVWWIWCQVGEFEFHFQNSYGELCFWKIILKVRFFKSTADHRPFLSKFDVKLVEIGYNSHKRTQVFRSFDQVWWDGVSKVSFKFLYTFWVYR